MAEAGRTSQRRFTSPNGSTRSGRSRMGDDKEELIEQLRRFSSVSQEDFEKMRLAEKEDDFFAIRKATDITDPDTKSDPCPPLPIKLIHGTFRHILGVREACSKQGTFLQRTIELKRKPGESLGFYIRQGDGWEREDGIFVSRVVLGTDVDVFELLRVGDEIVKVNKVDVRTMGIEDVSALMQMTRRLILTLKVLTPISSMNRKLAMKDGTNASTKSSTGTTKTSRSASLPASAHMMVRDRGGRMVPDRRYSTASRLSHEANYKVANLVIGRNKDALPSAGNATAASPVTTPPPRQTSRRSTKSPVHGKRTLSPIRESTTDLGHSDVDERARSSRAASVVSWSDQFYGYGGSTSPVKHKPNDRRKSEASGIRPR
ncbi:uncharacterized protein LOC5514570 [Nematostella vectensis]|uniref:uncharacterized protein LOC5514570 n=1 Tax=Nematostella vectensis TaxID=45351 RepID=UPI002076EBCF|nr:uncharacterized protein LOC5514570 [Nematostella vectensis]